MYFHSKMAWPPATNDVILPKHNQVVKSKLSIIFIVCSNKIQNRVRQRERSKNNNRSNQQTNNFARAAHFFLYISVFAVCFARLQGETFRNFLVTRLMKEMSYVFLFPFSLFFFHCRSFSPWWPLAFLIFWPPLHIFHVVLPTNNVSLFYISHSNSLLLFFSSRFSGLSPTFSFSLPFSIFTFQICGMTVNQQKSQSRKKTVPNDSYG